MLLNAYYLRHHMYTLVPHHVREDMQWMADVGSTAVSVGILEQDLTACRYNLECICREADRAGLQVHAVPTRLAGLVAGAPKVPGRFTVQHPEAAALDKQGQPYVRVSGIVASVHHGATMEHMVSFLDDLLQGYPIRGIIWDEVKNTDLLDYSQAARDALGPAIDNIESHIDATVSFFGRLNQHIKSARPDAVTSLFLYAHCAGYEVPAFAGTGHLDYFGCDGRPWAVADGGTCEDRPGQKCLLDHAPRYIDAARRNGKAGLILIENHNMPTKDYDLLDRRLGCTLALGAEHVLYYYYPRNLEDPQRQMDIIARHLKT